MNVSVSQEQHYLGNPKLALFVILPIFLSCYGGVCFIYCIYSIYTSCQSKLEERRAARYRHSMQYGIRQLPTRIMAAQHAHEGLHENLCDEHKQLYELRGRGLTGPGGLIHEGVDGDPAVFPRTEAPRKQVCQAGFIETEPPTWKGEEEPTFGIRSENGAVMDKPGLEQQCCADVVNPCDVSLH